MQPSWKIAIFVAFACIAATDSEAAERSRPPRIATDAAFKRDVLPIVETYCGDCHGADEPEAGISFHDLSNPDQILKDRDTWGRALKLMRVQGMPPLDYDDRPSNAEREAITEWLDLKLHHVDCDLVDDAGRVTIHRLNRVEYNNTVRDLLGVDIRPADAFPSDSLGDGFSNNGDALSLPPLLFEKYIDASERIAAAAIQTEPLDKQKQRFEGKQLKKTGSATLAGQGFFTMSSTGSVYRQHDIQIGGQYIIRVEAAADQAGPELAKCEVRVDGKAVKVHQVRGHREMKTYEVRRRLKKGSHRFEAVFINDYYNAKAEDPKDRDRNMAIRFIELQGPLNAAPPEVHRRIVFTKPSNDQSVEQAATKIFKRLMPRTFRRSVDAGEVARIVRLVKFATDRGESFERGVQIGLQAILVSPHFLFRAEFDSQPNNASAQHAINDFELASRLSYFLWSTMPDNELFRLARSRELHDPKVLDAQIARMLKDPRADALVDNFASQWLNLSNLIEVNPDQKLFPEFTPELRSDMVRETQMFARAIFRENRSLVEFLNADFTFANERLAKHYGIGDVKGNEMRRVSLPAGQRSGVLTQGAILTLTSNPDRTSLVRRGVWIVSNVLGLELPDPPGNIPTLEEGAKESGAKTMREQLKIHRESPACASCHETLDPLGFGFENFDAIGRWRVEAEGVPVDSGGTLPSGESFRGPTELVTILLKRKRGFIELVTKKMLAYALGRSLEIADSCAVDDIVATLEEKDYRFNVLVREIVHSKPFLRRRGDEGAGL